MLYILGIYYKLVCLSVQKHKIVMLLKKTLVLYDCLESKKLLLHQHFSKSQLWTTKVI